MFIIIIFWLGCDRPSSRRPIFYSFIRARFTSFHTHASLLASFPCFFILFHSCCSHAWVFEKTLVHEFDGSYSHLNGTSSFLSLVQENINMPSGHYYRLCSWSGRSKPSNKKKSLVRSSIVRSNVADCWVSLFLIYVLVLKRPLHAFKLLIVVQSSFTSHLAYKLGITDLCSNSSRSNGSVQNFIIAYATLLPCYVS